MVSMMLRRGPAFASALVALASAALAVVACATADLPDDATEAPLPERTSAADATVVGSSSGTVPPPPAEAGTDASLADGADADGAPRNLRVFVSSTIKTGNLGGVAGADALCNQLATAATLGGTYRAWLSVSGADAIDHITSSGPWHLVTGELVAADKATLTSGALKHLIDKTEKGVTPAVAEDRTWTGTGPNGRYVGPDCTLWTGAGSGLSGEARNATPNKWTDLVAEGCGQVNRVYCFEL
jgi:hypothetical protein